MPDDVHIFIDAIDAAAISRELKRSLRARNIWGFKKKIIYVKMSTGDRLFWGIGKPAIDSLEYVKRELRFDYWIILLDSSKSGFVFDSRSVIEAIGRGDWGLAGDNQYKINDDDLELGFRFLDVERFIKKTSE